MRPTEQYPSAVSGLPDAARRAVDQAVAAECLEGWRPTESDIGILVAECRGEKRVRELKLAFAGDGPTKESRWAALRPGHRPYLEPGSDVLRNMLGIVDAAELHRAESILTAIRLVRCHLGRADLGRDDGVRRLLALHRYLFQDVYSWAGRIRTVELSKNGTSFTRVSQIWDALTAAQHTITSSDWLGADRGELAFLLSRTYAELNHAHPFREGNGRTGTMFLHLLLEGTQFRLDLTDVSRADWVSASVDSAPFRQSGAPSPRPFLPIFRDALAVR